MIEATTDEFEVEGTHGRLFVRYWQPAAPTFGVLLAHGYAEHSGRYDQLARKLAGAGGIVFAPDHAGHGRSEGERAHMEYIEDMVTDLRTVAAEANTRWPSLPWVLIGHSLGGLLATRYVQRSETELAALVLSGPVIGGNPAIMALVELDPMPDVPLDPAILSRDPAVGEQYAADPLVYHGPFRRESLQALAVAVEAIAAGPGLSDLPTLWLHGESDALAPLTATRPAIERIAGSKLRQKFYPGAQHEIFNETNSAEVIDDVLGFLADILGSKVNTIQAPAAAAS